MLEPINFLINFILNIDVHLEQLISSFGNLTYVFLFLIIFVETGLVFVPFLPGDSLLFAAGAFSALGSLNIVAILLLLSIAAILGDTVNYWVGRLFGEKIIKYPKIPINQSHIDKTNKFFEKHGGKTIILARFVPIVRTFAPFIAGIGKMSYQHFLAYNVIGGIIWVFIFSLAGFFFGNIPQVKHNFSIVIIVIVLISVLPMVFELIKSKSHKKQEISPTKND